MTFRMGKRAAMEMHLGNKEVYQVRQGEALVYAKYHTITQTLDGVTSDAPSSVAWGDGMVVSFTPGQGMALLPSTVRVTMGGVDVTDTAFRLLTNTIEIPSVTDDVEIKAEAAVVNSAYKPVMWVQSIYVANAANTPFNTEYLPNEKTVLKMDVAVTSNSASTAVFGIMNGHHINPMFCLWSQYLTNNVSAYFWNNSSIEITGKFVAKSVRQNIIANGKYITLTTNDGTRNTYTVPSSGTFQAPSTRPLWIGGMAWNTYGNCFWGGIRLYRVEISEGGVKLMDLIPAQRLSDGLFGLYDIINGTFNAKSASYWLGTYKTTTRTLTNCTASRLSDATTGTAANAVIGSTWSIKLTPSSDYTFAGGVSPQVKIANVDVTSQVVTDNGDGTYTITIVNVPQEPIEITAEAVALPSARMA